MDELFRLLGAISDDFLEEEQGRVDEYTEQLLGSLTEEDLEGADLVWWSIILLDLLGPMIEALPLEARAGAIQGHYGRRPSGDFGDAVKERLRGVVGLEAARLHSRTQDAKVGGELGEDFLAALHGAVTRAVENVISEADTTMSMFDRLAFAEMAKYRPGKRRWAYDGPRDAKNRPFCAAVLDARLTYSEGEVQALNEHPLLHKYVPPNVKTLCGGHACRHVFVALTEGEAGSRGLAWEG